MFTWEEAGLLRQMLQILFWGVICAALAVVLTLGRGPIGSMLQAGWQYLGSAIQTLAR